MPEVPIVSMDSIRKEFSDADEKTYERARAHAARNCEQAITPLQKMTDKLDAAVFGSQLDIGLQRKMDDNTRRIATMESSFPAALDNLTDEIRALTQGGRTPRNGTHVQPDSDPPPSKRKPLLSRDDIKSILFLLAALTAGGGSVAFNAMRDEPAPASTAAIDQQRAELERRERELVAREQRARWRGPAPSGTGGGGQ